MTLGPGSLRYLTAVTCHVPGTVGELVAAGGERVVVSARPRGDDLPADAFRRAVGEAWGRGHQTSLRALLSVLPGPPVLAVVRDNPPAVVDRQGSWRHTCVCGLTDYLLADGNGADVAGVAEEILREVWPVPARHLWVRRDSVLHVTVLGCSPPSDPGAPTRYERALGELASAFGPGLRVAGH